MIVDDFFVQGYVKFGKAYLVSVSNGDGYYQAWAYCKTWHYGSPVDLAETEVEKYLALGNKVSVKWSKTGRLVVVY